MSENQPTASEKKPAKKKPNQRRDNQHGHRNHAESEQGGSQNRRHIPRHQQSHKVDMKKYEKMISDIHSNFSDIKSSNGAKDDCVICCKPCDIFGLGECRHPICIECCLRIRVLNGQKGCPVCRQELEVVSLLFASNGLETCSLDNQKHGHPAEDRFGIRFENKDVGERYEQYLAHVCKICKTPEGERLEFNTFNALRMHMSNAHQLTYCNICTENLNLFSRERKTYNRQNLQHHIREGDVDDKSQRGHPSCLFCEQRFFDTDGQYRHLRKDHFYCQFCEADGTMTNHFFGKHEELLKHYKAKHFLCEHESCRNVGIAFSTLVEFNLHKTQHSGKSMHLDFQYNDRQVIGHGRTRRDQGQRFQGGPNERIAVVPAEPVQQPPPRPNTEIIVVPSAQARNITIRYGRSSYSARQEDFPSLPGGLEGSTQSSAPQVVVPQQFPRLNKTGRAAAAASKPQQPPKKPAEDFPSLGGRKGSQQQQQGSNWGQHTGNFEVIDDDERAASASRPQLPASVLAPPPKQQAIRQQTKVQPRKPPSPIPSEDFPSLPANAYTGLSSQTNWAAKAHGKSAITGLVMPKKKKLAQPDILPERSVTTPASSYQPVEETWEAIPYAKKLTVKQRRELQKEMEEARELQQEETMREIQEQMMVEPDEDLEMQAILMNDIASSSGVSSAESSRNNKKKGETVLREKNTAVEANNNKTKNNKKKEKKEPKPKEKLPDFPSLQSTTKKLDPKPPTPEPQQSTGLSWLLNSVSALTGLSLSNVLGTDHSLPLSSMPTEVARNTPTKEVAPPPGLSTPSTPTTAAPPPGLSFAPPPGFEHVTPPPGLPTPPDMFSSAPFLSHQDVAKPRAPSSQKQNSDGWSKKTKTK